MTQLIVTIEKEADPSVIRQVLQNIKGILSVKEKEDTLPFDLKKWEQKLTSMREKINPSLIDMEDERTRYIMSK